MALFVVYVETASGRFYLWFEEEDEALHYAEVMRLNADTVGVRVGTITWRMEA